MSERRASKRKGRGINKNNNSSAASSSDSGSASASSSSSSDDDDDDNIPIHLRVIIKSNKPKGGAKTISCWAPLDGGRPPSAVSYTSRIQQPEFTTEFEWKAMATKLKHWSENNKFANQNVDTSELRLDQIMLRKHPKGADRRCVVGNEELWENAITCAKAVDGNGGHVIVTIVLTFFNFNDGSNGKSKSSKSSSSSSSSNSNSNSNLDDPKLILNCRATYMPVYENDVTNQPGPKQFKLTNTSKNHTRIFTFDVTHLYNDREWNVKGIGSIFWGTTQTVGVRKQLLGEIRKFVPSAIISDAAKVFINASRTSCKAIGGSSESKSVSKDLCEFLGDPISPKGVFKKAYSPLKPVGQSDDDDDGDGDDDDTESRNTSTYCRAVTLTFAFAGTNDEEQINSIPPRQSQDGGASPGKLSDHQKKEGRLAANQKVGQRNAAASNKKEELMEQMAEMYETKGSWLYMRCNSGHTSIISQIIGQHTNLQKWLADEEGEAVRTIISQIVWSAPHIANRCGGKPPGEHLVNSAHSHPLYSNPTIPDFVPTIDVRDETRERSINVKDLMKLENYKHTLQTDESNLSHNRRFVIASIRYVFELMLKLFWTRGDSNENWDLAENPPKEHVHIPEEYMSHVYDIFSQPENMKKIQNMIPELEQNISSVDNAAWVNLLTLSTLKDRNYQSSEQLEDMLLNESKYITRLAKWNEVNSTSSSSSSSSSVSSNSNSSKKRRRRHSNNGSNKKRKKDNHPGLHPFIQIMMSYVERSDKYNGF